MKPSTHTAPPQAPTAETLDEKETPDLPQSTLPAAEDVSHDPFHDLIPGYPQLAGRMGIMPEIGMFRRFGALNARSLLYYQNELAYLEDQLKETEAEDAKSPEGKKAWYSHNAYWLNTADRTTDDELRDGDMRQRDLVMRIRCLLKEYSTLTTKQRGSTLIKYRRRRTHPTVHHTPKHEGARCLRPRRYPALPSKRPHESPHRPRWNRLGFLSTTKQLQQRTRRPPGPKEHGSLLAEHGRISY